MCGLQFGSQPCSTFHFYLEMISDSQKSCGDSTEGSRKKLSLIRGLPQVQVQVHPTNLATHLSSGSERKPVLHMGLVLISFVSPICDILPCVLVPAAFKTWKSLCRQFLFTFLWGWCLLLVTLRWTRPFWGGPHRGASAGRSWHG